MCISNLGLVLKALPVSTLAQSMINDAYQYKKTNSPPHGVNPVILTNTDIYRIASATELEVRIDIYIYISNQEK